MGFLIVSDIDHTLLNDKGELVTANVDALAKARAQGATVILSTARSFGGTVDIHQALDLETPLIVSNGTLVITKAGEVLNAEKIANNTVVDVLELYAQTNKHWLLRTPKYPFMHPALSTTGGPFGFENDFKTMDTMDMLEHIQNNGHTPIIAASLFGTDLENFYNTHDWQEMGLVSDYYPPSHYHSNDGMSVMSNKASKGNAARWLQNYLGLNDLAVIALGDNVADATMFDLGIGIAPENAKPEVKEQADWIAPHCDDGAVAAALEKFVF